MATLDSFGNPLTINDGPEAFSTYARSEPEALEAELSVVSNSAVLDGIMKSMGGMVAVMNRYRQVLVVNDNFFRKLGIPDAASAVGLRLGEAVDCAHLDEAPKGCGTGKFCASCGAAIAMVTSLNTGTSVEKKCVGLFRRSEGPLELCLNVRATPLRIGSMTVIVALLRDVSEEELHATAQQVFFHDLGNVVAALVGGTSLLINRVGRDDLAAQLVSRNMSRLQQELTIQRVLAAEGETTVAPVFELVAVEAVIKEVTDLLQNHPSAHGKLLRTTGPTSSITIYTSASLLLRVLCNMVINAMEATPQGGEVLFAVEAGGGTISFSVRNSQAIPLEIRPRIFQRFFTTKEGKGRGFGTYIIKKFGETALGGKVSFSTSDNEGTTFLLSLPQPHLSEPIESSTE